MVENTKVSIPLILLFTLIQVTIFAQPSKVDTTSIGILASLNCDTIQRNDTLKINIQFCNNTAVPVYIFLGGNLQFAYKSGFSVNLKYIDEGIENQRITILGHDTFELLLNIKASEYLDWYGVNEFSIFYFALYNEIRYFSFSKPLTIYMNR